MSKTLEEQNTELNEALAQANDYNLELLGQVNRLATQGVPDGTCAVVLTHDPKSGLSQLAWTEHQNEAEVALALLGALRKIISDLPCMAANRSCPSSPHED